MRSARAGACCLFERGRQKRAWIGVGVSGPRTLLPAPAQSAIADPCGRAAIPLRIRARSRRDSGLEGRRLDLRAGSLLDREHERAADLFERRAPRLHREQLEPHAVKLLSGVRLAAR
jgi:hypothetical protein